jgi:threonine/homoserine/homoserine lactone efflux protein
MDEIVALAFGIAASPFPIIPAVLLLFTERPRAAAFSFLGTWFISIAVVAAGFAVLSGVIASDNQQPTWIAWVRIVAGIGLVGFAVGKWVTRPSTVKTPSWMRRLETATPRSASVLALVLSVANPKVLLLAAAGGIDIGSADWIMQQQILVVGVFALVASTSVAAPVVAYTLAGPRVLRPLSVVKDWLLRNNVAVMSVVFLVLGALLIYNGVTGL